MVSTANAAIKTSGGSGNWVAAGSWSPTGVPANGDIVIIASGHTITVNTNTNNLLSLTINGTLVIGNNNADRTVAVSGTITIASGGIFRTAGNGGNELEMGGQLINNGTFDMSISGSTAEVTLNGSANQSISGSGATMDFDRLIINNNGAANNNIAEILSTNFTAAAGFLTLTRGILKMSGSFNFSNTFFNSASPVIHSDEGLWLNNANATITGQNGDTQLDGLLRLSDGTYIAGNTSERGLLYNSGANFMMEGGALNIAGAFAGATSSSTINFNQSGGTITVNTIGNNNSVGSFDIRAAGSVFAMSGGTIVLQKAATAYTDYINFASSSSVTGGKIQAGNAATPFGTVFWANSIPVVYDLEVKATNAPVFQLRSSITVLNDVIISGVLDAATQNVHISVGRNWINNGIFLPGTSTNITFNGTLGQSIGGITSTVFNHLTVNNTGGNVTLNTTATISGSASFTAGILTSTAITPLIFLDNATTSGANNNSINPSYVDGPVQKTGDDAFTFPIGKTGSGYHPCGISAPLLVTDVFTAAYMRSSAIALGGITAPGLYRVSTCDYWNIDRTIGVSPVDVTLSWNSYSNCNAATYVNNLGTLTIAHFNGTQWDTHSASSVTGTVSSGTITRNAVATFSPFSLGSTTAGTNPLPVKFSAIKASAAGNENKIEWTNLTEERLLKYELERSADGRTFTRLLETTPRMNTGGAVSYVEMDRAVNNNMVFYRVKAIDQGSEINYSAIVSVNRTNNGDPKMLLYPNPVPGKQFTIQLYSVGRSDYSVELLNSIGQVVTKTLWLHAGGAASRTIELPATANPGIYIVQVSGDGKQRQSKILVQ